MTQNVSSELKVEFMSFHIYLSKDMAEKDLAWGMGMIALNIILG